jgi:hypothetical protein
MPMELLLHGARVPVESPTAEEPVEWKAQPGEGDEADHHATVPCAVRTVKSACTALAMAINSTTTKTPEKVQIIEAAPCTS